jgi:thioredoxin 1
VLYLSLAIKLQRRQERSHQRLQMFLPLFYQASGPWTCLQQPRRIPSKPGHPHTLSVWGWVVHNSRNFEVEHKIVADNVEDDMMVRILGFGAWVVASIIGLGGDAWARTLVRYEEAKVQEALAGGKLVVVEVFADWCPSCKKGHVALEKALDTVPELAAFQIDFDKDEDLLARYKVDEQGTVLLVKDGKEIARLAGEANADAVVAWLRTNGAAKE